MAQTIMTVDDSASVRQMVTFTLKKAGYEVVEAVDGKDGLTKLAGANINMIITDLNMPNMNGIEMIRNVRAMALTERPDLIISNMNLPDMDGIELCRRLKSTLPTKAVPVVLLGASETDRDIARGFEAGAAAYVEKKEAKFRLLNIARDLLAKYAFRRERLILVVDDSSSVRRMLMHGLLGEGFRIIGAENGKAALTLLKNETPDLILLDVCMPEMNGVKFCERLNADPVLSAIPIVVMATKSDTGNVKRMMQYGAASYILKPFNLEQLTLRLEKILADQFQIQAKEKELLDTEHNLLISGMASLANALEARD